MTSPQGPIGGYRKKYRIFEKCFFCQRHIAELRYTIITNPISHQVYHRNSGQKIFFSEIVIFQKVTGPKKFSVPKNLSIYKKRTPPADFGSKNIDFSKVVQNRPKSVSRGIYRIQLKPTGYYFSKNSIFSRFQGVFTPPGAKKSDFSKFPPNSQKSQ